MRDFPHDCGMVDSDTYAVLQLLLPQLLPLMVLLLMLSLTLMVFLPLLYRHATTDRYI